MASFLRCFQLEYTSSSSRAPTLHHSRSRFRLRWCQSLFRRNQMTRSSSHLKAVKLIQRQPPCPASTPNNTSLHIQRADSRLPSKACSLQRHPFLLLVGIGEHHLDPSSLICAHKCTLFCPTVVSTRSPDVGYQLLAACLPWSIFSLSVSPPLLVPPNLDIGDFTLYSSDDLSLYPTFTLGLADGPMEERPVLAQREPGGGPGSWMAYNEQQCGSIVSWRESLGSITQENCAGAVEDDSATVNWTRSGAEANARNSSAQCLRRLSRLESSK